MHERTVAEPSDRLATSCLGLDPGLGATMTREQAGRCGHTRPARQGTARPRSSGRVPGPARLLSDHRAACRAGDWCDAPSIPLPRPREEPPDRFEPALPPSPAREQRSRGRSAGRWRPDARIEGAAGPPGRPPPARCADRRRPRPASARNPPFLAIHGYEHLKQGCVPDRPATTARSGRARPGCTLRPRRRVTPGTQRRGT